MSLIYCNINLFDYNQDIYMMTDEGKKELICQVTTNEVSSAIAAASANHNIYNIKLYGAEEEYVKNIAENIIITSSLDYSEDQNPLRIEVNDNEIFN